MDGNDYGSCEIIAKKLYLLHVFLITIALSHLQKVKVMNVPGIVVQ